MSRELIPLKSILNRDVLAAGTPKGVLLTHQNVLSAVGAVWHLLHELLDDTDTYLAFLPLAHILEFVVEMCWIFAGLPIGYGRVKTLTEQNVRECHGDFIEFKPSIIVGVPAVSEQVSGTPAKLVTDDPLSGRSGR